ncbi:MAG: acyl-homoserine-lactone acylase [Solirubrobacteraceae bacterium]|nr:acyl-homoserine-lactone acylase [Solirubrobacteraceae bacterium]
MRRLLAVVALALCAALPAADAQAAKKAKGPSAVIRRSAHGIPHIQAKTWEGLGYGYGYAFARDNLCTMADDYVTVRAERSRYFGPTASYSQRGNGTTPNNLNSDFFYQRVIDTHVVEKLLAKSPPQGPLPVVKQAVKGYVRGYDRYLADTGVANLTDPACRGKPWVKPITEMDAYRRFYQLGILASQSVAIDGIGEAHPPTPGLPIPLGTPSAAMLGALSERFSDGFLGIGSNAVGLGSQATSNGKGLLLGNPHFPWSGTERLWEAHVTIPGKVNVIGGSLYGVPAVLIGHTDGLAWSHTVSTAFRFTPFELKLVPGSPTTYLYNGQPRQMTADKVTVQVLQADGSLKPQTRTLYSSLQGPIFDSLLGLPAFPWTPERAYAMGDGNGNNFRYLNHYFSVDTAQTVQQLDAIERKYQGIPWVNTIGADKNGKAYYADIGSIPNVPNSKVSQCVNGALGLAVYQAIKLPVLDGSSSSCAWDNDPDAVVPGIFGPSHEPSLFRNDYVENSNDSYWLSNPQHPLEGFARMIGDERTARSLRTRNGLTMIQRRLAGKDGRKGTKFSLGDMTWMVFNDRQYAGILWRDQLVAMCKADGTEPSSAGPVDVSAACPILANFNLTDNLDSKGAPLFRRFVERVRSSPAPVSPPTASAIYANPFSASDPVNTPNGLNTDNAQVKQALGDAVNDLQSSGIPLDATLRNYQYVTRNGQKIPIHGGPGTDGVFNAINVPWKAGVGWPDIPHGSSFVMVTQFQKHGCPKNRSIVTYSQSTNPNSPFYADQTRMFSRKKWVDPPFCPAQVLRRSKVVTRLGPNGVIKPRARRR